jgi:hypothetical protein
VADVALIATATAFFALCVAYVRGLDRLVRSAADDEDGNEA